MTGGARKGDEIFRYLLTEIAPTVLIVHGVRRRDRGSCSDWILKINGLKVPRSTDEVWDVQTEQHLVIPIPSLAPPEFNKWSSWSEGYLEKVAIRVRDKLAATNSGRSDAGMITTSCLHPATREESALLHGYDI